MNGLQGTGPQSLFLIGPRGAGKSSAGLRAACVLGVPFVDTDAEVEARADASIATIFATQGEPAFRALEREVVLGALRRKGELVATGGGAVLDAEVRAALAAAQRTVWLTATPKILAERIRGTRRPSLTGRDPALEIADVLAARDALYAACASLTIDTKTQSLDDVVAALCRAFLG